MISKSQSAVTCVEEVSTGFADPGPLAVFATPSLLVTPPTPTPHLAEHQTFGTPLSCLTVDLHDVSESSTVCDDATDTSPASKNEGNPSPKPGDCFYSDLVSRPARKRQGTVASACSEATHSISPSYATESGPGDKEGSADHEAAKAWSNGARAMMELDEANVQRWKEEIDTLLVFSGIFSAVVTGFLTETMRLLRPEPSATTVAVLERISAQLRNPQDIADLTGERFIPNRHIVQVNALWFTSLILSLGVAFVGILVKQWLGEYSSGIMAVSRSRISKKHARARQYRHAAFERWRVGAIMTALPFFLLSALILFCGGLSLLLVTMDLKVGIVAIGMIGFILAFYAATTILPSVWDACPYRSPQAFWVFLLVQAALYLFRACTRWVYAWILSSDTPTDHELADLKLCPTRSVGGLASKLPKPCSWTRFREWTKRTGGQRTYWSWREREEATLLSSRGPYQMALLDELDSVKMDVAVLQDVVRPCLLTLPPDEAIPCFRNILNRRAEVVVQGLPTWESDLDRETCRALVDMLLDMLSRPEPPLDSTRAAPAMESLLRKHEEVLGMLYRLIGTGRHRSFLSGSYDRIFAILLRYIREPQRQHVNNDAPVSWLVMMTLATLQDKIPPNAVTKEDVLRVREYAFHAADIVISLRAAALAFSMILALPSTGDIYNLNEDLFEAVRSMVKATGRGLRATTFRNQPSGDDLMRILPSLHVYLSSLEALLRVSPTFLAEVEWRELYFAVSRLATNYTHVHRCVYIDSNGRDTNAYADVISKLVRGLEVPPPQPGVRRQTLTPDVLTPVTVQEPGGRPPKPPSKARVHWSSWLDLSSFRAKAASGEDLPREHLV